MAGPVIPNIQQRIQTLQQQLAAQQARPVQNAQRVSIIQNLTEAIARAQANLEAAEGTKARNQQYGEQMRAELSGAVGLVNAQAGQQAALYEQAIGQQRVMEEGDIMQSQRDLEAFQRAQEGDFGGRDMIRSGVFQAESARGVEENTLERAQVMREYQATIDGLQAQIAAGADARIAQVAAERARIRAAYRLARLNAGA